MNMLEKIIVYDSFPRARRIAAQLLSNMVVNSPGGTKLLHLLKRIAENVHIDSQMRVYIKNAFNQLKEQKKKKKRSLPPKKRPINESNIYGSQSDEPPKKKRYIIDVLRET